MRIITAKRIVGMALVAGLMLAAVAGAKAREAARRVISLDGVWQIAEGKMNARPETFDHTVPVPGLADMAKPAFAAVGKNATRNEDGSQFTVPDPGQGSDKNSSQYREAFWYRRTFKLKGLVPEVALLKLYKAKYGAKVFINGKEAGEHLPCFTPGYFDLRPYLKGEGAENELVVRIGAAPYCLPRSIPFGLDFEKKLYIPGIYDSVELILSGTPRIVRVQAAPDIKNKTVRVVARIGAGGAKEATVRFDVREAAGGKVVGSVESAKVSLAAGGEQDVEVKIPIEGCRLWSPEDPFLYELTVDTGADKVATRFGMRDFRFDPQTKRPMLNGKPYYLRGSNICILRFEEEAARGDKPWNEAWVRKLLRQYKSMNWNSGRICIGFPPEMWYRVADEEGLLLQDEYPIWYPFTLWPPAVTSQGLVAEFTEWVQERWNHPCVAIWDASNETTSRETGMALSEVRKLDLSDRPWDNSWNWSPVLTDVYESHAYAAGFVHAMNDYREPSPGDAQIGPYGKGTPLNFGNTGVQDEAGQSRPVIINEFCWLWLNHDGSVTDLTKDQWSQIMQMGPDKATNAERILAWNQMIAEAVEYLRSGRKLAGVHEFCFLSSDRHPTIDHFTDYDKLTLEPTYERLVREAYAPVGLSIDYWDSQLPAGRTIGQLPVVLINDLYTDWKGPVKLSVLRDGKAVTTLRREAAVAAVGRSVVTFALPVPAEAGKYQLVAEIQGADGKPVHSYRNFTAVSPVELYGVAEGKGARASSALGGEARYAFDGDRRTKWMSEDADPQWIEVDLGKTVKLNRAKIFWGREYAKAYAIEASPDGRRWTPVFEQKFGLGGIEEFALAPTDARWVRLTATEQGARFGYSILELRLFGAEVPGSAAGSAEAGKGGAVNPNQASLEKVVKKAKEKK